MKVFQSRNLYEVKGKVLPLSEFKLFRELDGYTFSESKLKKAVEQAEKMLTEEIPFLPASLYRDFTVTGNRARYEALFFKRRTMALTLAFAEHYEKQGRFSEKLMDVVWAILEESTWILPAHLYNSPYGGDMTLGPVYNNEKRHGLALFSAATGAMLTAVHILAGDALDAITPIITEKLRYMVRQRLILPFIDCTFWWTGDAGNRVNNWNPWVISNVLFATAVFEDDLYTREKVVELAVKRLDNFLNCYHPDGGCDEGPSYWGAAGASLFDCLELIDDMTGGKITVYDNELVRNIGEYIFKVNIDMDRFVNFADCPPRTLPSASLLIRYGEKCGSPFLTSFGRKLAAKGDNGILTNSVYRGLRVFATPDIEAVECPMPVACYLPDLKVMSVRETSDSAKGMFLAAKGGSNGEQHNHNDVGNFMIYYDGKPIIIDTGVGTYTRQTFSPERYELWFMQSGYHNLPSFDGVDEKEGGRFASRDEVFDEAAKSLSVELAGAYPEAAGVISFVRKSALTGGVVTVTDRIKLNGEKKIDMHLMSAVLPVIEGDTIKLAEGRVLTYPRDILTAEAEEFDPVGMSAKGTWGTEKLWRIHLTATATEIEYTLTVK